MRLSPLTLDDLTGQAMDGAGLPARQARLVTAVQVQILVNRDETEHARGAKPEVVILYPEQRFVIATD
ncbi:MAG: hypothetical protein VW935_05750 [Novosphingobium sp.]